MTGMPATDTAVQPPSPSRRSSLHEKRGDLLFAALLSSLLFAYAGFILAVILADVSWLSRPAEVGKPRAITAVLATPDLFDQVKAAFLLSFATSFITSILAMGVAIPSAYALSRYRLPFKAAIDTIIDLPIVIPPLLAGISLLIFFNQSSLGLAVEEWWRRNLGDGDLGIVYSRVGIIVAQFFIASAFCIRAVKAAIDQVNPRFEAVARSLGCGPVRAFWKVTLPLARTGLVAGWIMTWTRAMGEFAPIMVLAGARFGTAVLPVTAFLNLSGGDLEVSVAITVLMILLATGTLLLFKRLGGKGYIW